jgi:hypothetical protein
MARRKIVKEQAPIQPVEEPTPELSSSLATATPTDSHGKRPQDQPVGEGMSRADKISAVINAVMTADEAKVNQVLATVAQPAPEGQPAKPEEAPEMVPDEAAPVNHSSILAKEAVDVIFAGEELSEELKNRAAALYEATVNTKMKEIEEQLTKELSEDFEAQFKAEVENIQEAVDSYLTDAVKEYIAENKLAVENGLKSDLYENMITDISNVIRSYNFAINDDQIDLVTEAYQELEQAKTDLNEQIEKNMSQRSHINELEKALVFEAVSADLPLMQRERLRTLAENVDADDAKTLTDKLSVLKERFVTESFDTAAALKDISSNAFYLDEQVEVEENTKYVDGNIKKYVDAVSNHVRKK